MKKIIAVLFSVLSCFALAAPTPEPVEIRELDIEGRIDGDNITYAMSFTARVNRADAVLPLVTGPVTLLDIPPALEQDLLRDANGYAAKCPKRGDRAVALRFAARPAREGDSLTSRLQLPVATMRRVSVRCDREELDVRFENAVDVKRGKTPDGGVLVTASLPPGSPLVVRWQPKIRRLAGELVVECDVNELAVARAGALKLDSLFLFRVVQGSLSKLSFDVPEGETVTQVRGADVREWSVEQGPGAARVLNVTLSRPQEKTYPLQVEHERALPPLPCAVELAPLAPRGALRASGFVVVGAEGAMRLVVKRASGLTQIDRAAFTPLQIQNVQRLAAPDRGSYAYQFANLPWALSLGAEDVVTSLQAEERLTLAITDNDIALEAAVDVDVRDAPARELVIETETGWNVTAVEGQNVSDYDVKDEGGVRKVRVYFRTAALGRQLVNLRLEKTLAANATEFAAPRFVVSGARSERGYLALRGELGVTLRPAKDEGLREVPVAALGVKVPGAQYAARFKSSEWTLHVAVVREQPSISAEIFELATFGESAVFGSSLVTYLINGAPVRTLRLAVPPAWRNVEVTGRDVRSWRNEGGTCVVSLQEKIVGDYTLVVTYDQPVPYQAGDTQAGGLRALDAANESGYLALAAPPGVALVSETNRPAGLLVIAPEELPSEYAVMIKDPLLRAYKYAGATRDARVAFRRYSARDLLDHAADLVLLNTRLSEEGEAVTELTCHVKNASKQYLGVTLPQGARLWSVAVDGQKAQALERGGGKILVPLPRKLDPNDPTRVDVACATQSGRIGWRQDVPLLAPALDARTMYARWTVAPPARFSIASVAGDLTPPAGREAGLRELVKRAWEFTGLLFRHAQAWPLLLLVLTLLCAVVAFNAGRGQPSALSSWVSATVAIVAVGFIVRMLDFQPHGPPYPAAPQQEARQAMAAEPQPGTSVAWTMSKAVALGDGGLKLGVRVERDWISIARTWAWPLAGLLLVLVAFTRGRDVPAVFGIYVAAALAAAAQTRGTIPPLAGLLVLFVLLAAAVAVVRAALRAGRARRRLAPPQPVATPEELTGLPPSPQNGSVDLRVLLAVALFAGLAFAAEPPKPATPQPATPPAAKVKAADGKVSPPARPPEPPPADLVMSRTSANIVLPGPTQDGTPPADANVELQFTFRVDRDGDYFLMPGKFVLTGFTSSSKKSEVIAKDGGYWLRVGDVRKAGWFSRRTSAERTVTIRYRAPVVEVAGTLQTAVYLPPHLANEIAVTLPSPDWTIESSAAAFLKMGEGREAATARIIASGCEVPLAWRPRTRVASLEKASFFAEVQTVARVRPGLVSLTHFIRHQIAQGELQTMRFDVPAGATVTAVSGQGLGTWRFDPATRLLEAVLEKPVTGDYVLRVVTQVSREGLPYEADLHELTVRDAARQRGVIALIADDGVQISTTDPTGAAAMYPGDFPADVLANEAGRNAATDVKRAYRYQQPPVSLHLSATRVETELRAEEQARVDITDERVVLSSRLQLDIAKAGVFTVWLELPEGFDIDALSGDDVSHWDEVKDTLVVPPSGGTGGDATVETKIPPKGGTSNPRAVAVHFTRQAQGARTLNLALSRQEKGRLDEIEMPRVSVRGALKHTGTLAVSSERGLRLSTVRRDGATELNPRDIGIQQTGYLAFRLLRPDWSLRVKIETAQAVVKAETVQRVTVSEGLLQARCRVQFTIEHAGVKTFHIRAPAPGVALVVTGPNLARVQQTDPAKGVWEVEMTSKREGAVALDVAYQAPYDAASGAPAIRSLVCEDAESQKGWIAVFAGGRLEVKSSNGVEGVEAEDPRAVPARFGLGDLSGAALCFRSTKGDVGIPLVVTRHETADLLAATVKSADISSAISEDGSMATLATIKLEVGNLRFLSAKLPAGADVWSAYVNGRAVKPLTEGEKLLIPMTTASSGPAEVELMYGARLTTGWTGRRDIPGPSFDLPLQNVTWRLFVPPAPLYRGFGGTLIYREEQSQAWTKFSPENYERLNDLLAADNNRKAAQILQQGQEFSKAGRNDLAKQALEEAISYSQSDRSLNEDARIQFRGLARQQTVAGIAARRSALKIQNNVAAAEDIAQTQAFNGGNFRADWGLQVQQNLGAKESESLMICADKMLEQQVAAGGEVHPVRITLPAEGRMLTFTRELQVQPDAEMRVEFVAGSNAVVRWLLSGGIALGLALVLGTAGRFAFGRAGV